MFSKYGKAIAAVITAAFVVAYQAMSGDNRIEADEWVSVAIAVTTAAGVYLTPLAPTARWTKTAIGGVLAVLQILTSAILGGIEPGEWLLMVITFAGAIGVYAAPAITSTPEGQPDVVVTAGNDN